MTMLAALIAAFVAVAQVQPTADEASIASCLIENHTQENEKNMADFIVAAIEGEKATAQASMMRFGMGLSTIAMTHCGVEMNELQAPSFAVASEAYGQWLGEKIIGDAMGKLSLD